MRCGSKAMQGQVFCYRASGHPDEHRNGSFHWSSSIVREQWRLVGVASDFLSDTGVTAYGEPRAYEYRREGPGKGSSNGILFTHEFSRRASR